MPEPFFFLHLPRTAGTTVNDILRANFRPGEILSLYRDSDFKRLAGLGSEALEGIRLIQGHTLLHSYDPPLMYSRLVRVFTFLRHPVTRLVSEYAFLKTWPETSLYRFLNDNAVTFRDYLTSKRRELRYRGKNPMTRLLSGCDFDLDGFPRQALDTAKRHLESVFGCFGLQERFDESLLVIGDFLGLQNVYYERRNVLAKGVKEDVGEADVQLALEKNAADMELYAFACELFAARVAAKGPGFAARVRRFRAVNARYAKVCALIAQKTGTGGVGDIENPKDAFLFPDQFPPSPGKPSR
ncbi:hypothetical protein ASZ90_001135 [hydrocarbon metagenome]|uniref:Sulfotransferase family protein n=1 Tax=hydrocarbon metagenome TaxID=938273 RepID=A0A0W8G720_9ZZZZ